MCGVHDIFPSLLDPLHSAARPSPPASPPQRGFRDHTRNAADRVQAVGGLASASRKRRVAGGLRRRPRTAHTHTRTYTYIHTYIHTHIHTSSQQLTSTPLSTRRAMVESLPSSDALSSCFVISLPIMPLVLCAWSFYVVEHGWCAQQNGRGENGEKF